MRVPIVDIQKSVSNLECATGKAFYNGMAEVGQVAAAYGPMVASRTVKLSGHVRLSLALSLSLRATVPL